MEKPATETPRGREQRHMIKARGAEWLTDALLALTRKFCSFTKTLFYEKETRFKSIN